MERQDRQLLRKLAIALVVKLLALGVLWGAFVRDHRVPVDIDTAVRQVLGDGQSHSLPETE